MILGLDLGSRLMGVCAGDGRALPIAETWAFGAPKPGDYGHVLRQLRDYLDIAFARFGTPALVAYEGPIMVGQRDNMHKLRLLYPLSAFVQLYCADRHVPWMECSVASLKKELTGSSRAEKADMVAMAHKLGVAIPDGPKGEDAADALAVWLIGLRKTDKRLSEQWDRRIYTPRGALI